MNYTTFPTEALFGSRLMTCHLQTERLQAETALRTAPQNIATKNHIKLGELEFLIVFLKMQLKKRMCANEISKKHLCSIKAKFNSHFCLLRKEEFDLI